jgi:hypothetical protein
LCAHHFKAEQATEDCQTAAPHAVIVTGEHGTLEFTRIGMMQALSPKSEPVYHSPSKDLVWRNHYKPSRNL